MAIRTTPHSRALAGNTEKKHFQLENTTAATNLSWRLNGFDWKRTMLQFYTVSIHNRLLGSNISRTLNTRDVKRLPYALRECWLFRSLLGFSATLCSDFSAFGPKMSGRRRRWPSNARNHMIRALDWMPRPVLLPYLTIIIIIIKCPTIAPRQTCRGSETLSRQRIMPFLQLPHLDDGNCTSRPRSCTISELHRINVFDFEDGVRFFCSTYPAAMAFPWFLGRVQY